ncbi:hypothetical protein CDD81_1594 [Ophiocordyceps australis]|uniref:Uncharacterized protein n=1 Tax=Ophiocordyceps australis TaxID=1399860 RepID=A0A2C5Y0K7_9HYPO|nr:hypothetical protein CDD81_1594 [Ophiocordyceps australis]
MLDTGDLDFILFGDQTVEKLPAIRQLVSHASGSRLVQRFLREACDAVQIEVSKMPAHSEQRRGIGSFDSILRLAEDNAALEEPNEIVATAVMNVARLGEYILYAEEDPSVLASSGKRSKILGFCTGEVAAAVAAVAQDSAQLVDLAVEATRIAFRLARELHQRWIMVDATSAPWAKTVLGVSAERVEAILQDFHESELIPRVRQACIGFVSDNWLTIFAPPKTLARLFSWSTELDDAPSIDTDVRGGVHMQTLPALDIDCILGSSVLLAAAPSPKTVMISPYTCHPRRHATLGSLLAEIIADVAQRTLKLSASMDAALDNIQARKLRAVIPGYTTHEVSLLKALQKRGIEYTVMAHGGKPAARTGRQGSGQVAIVGMSGKFPGSGDVETFWEHLMEGKRYIEEIPNTRFNLEKWFDKTGKQKNSTLARTGAFVDQPGKFDHRLFNMSPREALQTDVQHRLLMTTSYEALEMAGYSPDGSLSTARERIASYFGQTTDDWREMVVHQGVDLYFATGNCRAFGPGRLNHHYKWGGPSYSIDTACASSISAITLACSGLLNRDCDMAVAGGGSVLVSPHLFSGLSRGGFLSSEGGCQTYQDDADGYVRGEGVGVVVLKRLEDALAEDDRILGVICGSGRNYSSDASSIMHPSAPAQEELYRKILNEGGVEANSISYIEMHGTGTQAGDLVEMKSVLSTFAQNRGRDNPLTVGAVKANIGHGEAAAGVCALIKTLMMLQTRQIAPQPQLPGPRNHEFPDLEALNVRIAGANMKLEPSPLAKGEVRVFLNSFDASGGNSCLLLQEAPLPRSKNVDERTSHVVTLSARSHKSLVGIKQRYLAYLRQHPHTKLADLAYTTTARRMHSSLRYAMAVSSTEQAVQKLEMDLAKEKTPRPPPAAPSIVFVFTGQGAQYAGMGSRLWHTSATFRRRVNDLQSLASALGLPCFVHLITETKLGDEEPNTVQMQLAVLTLELALADLWRAWGLGPAAVLGHSLGEYAALVVAGVLSPSDALFLVGRRAQIIADTLTPHEYAMLAVNLDLERVRGLLAGGEHPECVAACVNAPSMTVVSGPRHSLDKLESQLKEQGTRCTQLAVPYGFHSAQLDPMLAEFEDACRGVEFGAPQIPVFSTLLATKVDASGTFSPNYLARQAREPVNFVGALQALHEQDLANMVFVEMGPDAVCSGLIASTMRSLNTQPVCYASLQKDKDDWACISSALSNLYMAGVAIDWPALHSDFKDSVSLLDLPKYVFEEKEFWVSFPDPHVESSSAVAASPRETQTQYSTTLQRLVTETVQTHQVCVVFESSLADEHLRAAVEGHAVADAQICSSSLLLDMALSAAEYAQRKHAPHQDVSWYPLSVQKCIFHRALVLGPEAQTLTVGATLDLSTKIAHIVYTCRTADEVFELGGCEVHFAPAPPLPDAGFLVRSRMAALQVSAGHQLGKKAVYRLFDSVVRYADEYQGLARVYLPDDMQDALAEVSMADVPVAGGHFKHHPFLLDALVHLGGFLVNNGLRYASDVACLSTGFDALHVYKALRADATYTSYTFMEDSATAANLVSGNVYVFDGEELVAVVMGMNFHKMKKVALTHLLGPAAKHHAATPVKAAARVAQHKADAAAAAAAAAVAPPRAKEEEEEEASSKRLVEQLFGIIAREVGVEAGELQGNVDLGELGIDSLMAITIISVMHRETGVELPGTFFLENSTTVQVAAAIAAQG